MSMIQSRRWRPEKKAKKKKTCKASKNSHLHFLSSNSKVLQAFPKPFPIEMKPTNFLAKKRKKRDKKRERRGKREGEKAKRKVKTAVSLLNPKTILKCCFGHIPNVLTRPRPCGISARKSKIAHKKPRRCACAGTCYESCYELINN